MPLLGLPGNPVSAFVCARLFAVPLLERWGGRPSELAMVSLPLAAGLPANGIRRDHLRGRLTADGRAEAFAAQDSALLGRLAAADLLIVRPPLAPPAAAGTLVPCIRLDRFADVS